MEILSTLSNNFVIVVAALAIAIVIVFTIFLVLKFRSRVFNTVDDLPERVCGMKLDGVVVEVVDGSVFKFYHCPAMHKEMHGRKYRPLVVKMAGVETPDISQDDPNGYSPGAESKKYVENLFRKNPNVSLYPMFIDPYNRIVARIRLNVWFGEDDLSTLMIKNGMGCVNTSDSAEVSSLFHKLITEENKAMSKGVGFWKEGKPKPYKFERRIKTKGSEEIATPKGE